MDLSKLTTSDKLILGGGHRLPHLRCSCRGGGIDTDFGDFANNGWDYFLGGWVPLIIIAIMAGHVAVTRFSPDTKIPDLPVPWGQGYLIAGVVAAVIVVRRLLVPSDECAGGFCIDLDRKFGIFVAVIAAICVAAGGSMKLKEDDTAPPPPGRP